jgi:signal transduction histidine kinase
MSTIASSNPITKPQAPRPFLAQLWDFLTKPSDRIQEPDKRQQARFVSSLLVFILFAVIILVGNALRNAGTTEAATPAPVLLFIIAFSAVIYALSRTTHTELASILFIGSTVVELFIIHLLNPEVGTSFYYLIIGVLFSGILLSVRTTAILVAVIIVGLIAVEQLIPRTTDISGTVNFVAFVSGMLLIFVQFRNTLENTRKNQITAALQEVEKLNGTLSKTNEELVSASALAKESARLKSEFMATMSHELRTPLNAMIGFSGILLEGMGGEFDDETRHMVVRIEQNSQRLLTLINSVLDIAKIEAGRLDLVSAPMNLQKMVNGWHSQMGVLAEKKKLEFTSEIDPALPVQLYGDSERISQVVINLLSNAFKFTESGSVKLALKAEATTWKIQVTDSGIGIPPHALNYIFDEFRQIDGSSKRAYGGTGLGLAIVRNLCRMMEGNVHVASKLGEGSVFTVTLPLKPVPELQAEPIAEVMPQ